MGALRRRGGPGRLARPIDAAPSSTDQGVSEPVARGPPPAVAISPSCGQPRRADGGRSVSGCIKAPRFVPHSLRQRTTAVMVGYEAPAISSDSLNPVRQALGLRCVSREKRGAGKRTNPDGWEMGQA